MRTQVAFDCADPHAQAVFWAQVFGSTVEDHSEFADQLVADGRLPAEERTVINDRSAFRDVAACSDPSGDEPRLFFQRVPEGKVAKNRVHIDVHVDDAQKDAEIDRLVGLGAQLVETHSDRGTRDTRYARPRGQRILPALMGRATGLRTARAWSKGAAPMPYHSPVML